MESSEGHWEDTISSVLYKDYKTAKKNLDIHRRDFKENSYKNENGEDVQIFTFVKDESDSFICTDGKWTHDYGIYEVEVLET